MMKWDGTGINTYISQLEAVVAPAVEAVAKNITAQARTLVPVVTGSLQGTIDTEAVSDDPTHPIWSVNAGNVEGGHTGDDGHRQGAPVDYATEIEYNDTPYMTPAAEQGFIDAQASIGAAIRTIT